MRDTHRALVVTALFWALVIVGVLILTLFTSCHTDDPVSTLDTDAICQEGIGYGHRDCESQDDPALQAERVRILNECYIATMEECN